MLMIKIGPSDKMIIEVGGERIEVLSEKGVILGVLAKRENVSIHREKILIASEDKVSSLQGKE